MSSSNKKPKGLGKTTKLLRTLQTTLPSPEKPRDELQKGLDEDALDYGDSNHIDSDSEGESGGIVPSSEEPVAKPKPAKQSARKPADDAIRLQRGMTAIGQNPIEETGNPVVNPSMMARKTINNPQMNDIAGAKSEATSNSLPSEAVSTSLDPNWWMNLPLNLPSTEKPLDEFQASLDEAF